MIYELRIYRILPGRLAAMLSRMQNHTLRTWEKHGIRQVGVWTTLVGESDHQLTYMLAWESLAEREERWTAFLSDPDRPAAVAATEQDGPLIQSISNQFLAPTKFSALK